MQQHDIVKVLKRADELRQHEKMARGVERLRLRLRRQTILREITGEAFEAMSVAALLKEINALYQSKPADRLDYDASCIQVQLLWSAVDKRTSGQRDADCAP